VPPRAARLCGLHVSASAASRIREIRSPVVQGMGVRGLLRVACGLLLIVVLAASGGAAKGARVPEGGCTWGASSITATSVNGQLVESQPQTTGCIP